MNKIKMMIGRESIKSVIKEVGKILIGLVLVWCYLRKREREEAGKCIESNRVVLYVDKDKSCVYKEYKGKRGEGDIRYLSPYCLGEYLRDMDSFLGNNTGEIESMRKVLLDMGVRIKGLEEGIKKDVIVDQKIEKVEEELEKI